MEEVHVGGKRYISSKRAGKMTGYTHDYLGQLCRAGKLNCKRFGRVWYISEESVCTYKKKHKKEHENYVGQKRSSQPRSIFGAFSYKTDESSLQPEIEKQEQQKEDKQDEEEEKEESKTEVEEEEHRTEEKIATKSVKRSPHVADIRDIKKEEQKATEKKEEAPRIQATMKEEAESKEEKGKDAEEDKKEEKAPTKEKPKIMSQVRAMPITTLFVSVIILLFSVGTLMFERTVQYESSQQVTAQGFQMASINKIFSE